MKSSALKRWIDPVTKIGRNTFLGQVGSVGSETQLQPVSIEDHLAGERDEKDQQDKTAAASRAGCAPAKAEAVLEPIKKDIQHQEFE